jgi:AraC-like DNA-binding protein
MDVLLRLETSGDVSLEVVGTMTRALVSPPAAVRGLLGIRFRPGEALAFLDVALAEARDASLSALDAGLGPVDELRARVTDAKPAAWPRILDAWLLSRLARARRADARVRRAVEIMRAAGGQARVSTVSAHVGLSERHLERAFHERVGLSPKFLARVMRLRAWVGSLDSRLAQVPSAEISWAALAADGGFADQAHLVREVRALAGITPVAFARERMSGLFNTGS